MSLEEEGVRRQQRQRLLLVVLLLLQQCRVQSGGRGVSGCEGGCTGGSSDAIGGEVGDGCTQRGDCEADEGEGEGDDEGKHGSFVQWCYGVVAWGAERCAVCGRGTKQTRPGCKEKKNAGRAHIL